MRNVSPETITAAFAAYAAKAEDARTRDVLCSLATHLHAFVKETRLSHAEWMAGANRPVQPLLSHPLLSGGHWILNHGGI